VNTSDTNVKMIVEYPPTYPKIVPTIEIESESLDKEHIEGLLKQIKIKVFKFLFKIHNQCNNNNFQVKRISQTSTSFHL